MSVSSDFKASALKSMSKASHYQSKVSPSEMKRDLAVLESGLLAGKITRRTAAAVAKRTYAAAMLMTGARARLDRFVSGLQLSPASSNKLTAGLNDGSFQRTKIGGGFVFSAAEGSGNQLAMLTRRGTKLYVELYAPDSGGAMKKIAGRQVDSIQGTHPGELAMLDVNADGKDEVVFAGRAANGTFVLKPRADGTFSMTQLHHPLIDGAAPNTLYPVDLDGKGKKALLLLQSTATDFELVLLTPSASGLKAVQKLSAGNNGLYGVGVADLDGTGKRSLFLLNNMGGGPGLDQPLMQTFPITGGHIGTTPTNQVVPGISDGMAVGLGDVNHDGKPDLAVAGSGGINDFPGTFGVMVRENGNYDYALVPKAMNATANHPSSISLADLDANGKSEVYLPGGGDLAKVTVVRLDAQGHEDTGAGRASLTTLTPNWKVRVEGNRVIALTEDGVEVLTKVK